MKKTIVVVLSVLMSMSPVVSMAAESNIIRSGVLETNEVWSGTVEVKGDITVPKDRELVIKPGTSLVFDKNKVPDIKVYGTLKVGDSQMSDSQYTLLPVGNKTQIIQITPYEVDTKILRDEFNAFRIQYAIIWVLLGGGLIYAVAHR